MKWGLGRWLGMRWVSAVAGRATRLGGSVPKAQQQTNGEGHGGSCEKRRGVSRYGSVSEIYITVVFRERIWRFKPGMAVEAKEAHGWSTRRRRRVRYEWCSVTFRVSCCRGGVWRGSPGPSERGTAVRRCIGRRLSLSKRTQVRQLLSKKSCSVGVEIRCL